MIVYKAFQKGLVCRGYQFNMGLNVTDKANCVQNGFHAAENPLDCFSYYRIISSENHTYCLCDAGGDIDEDGCDSKISCTELDIIKELTLEEMAAAALIYIKKHPLAEFTERSGKLTCAKDSAALSTQGIAIVRGLNPKASGVENAVLGLVKDKEDGTVDRIRLYIVDNVNTHEGTWYGIEGRVNG